jgi:hypothetical protein
VIHKNVIIIAIKRINIFSPRSLVQLSNVTANAFYDAHKIVQTKIHSIEKRKKSALNQIL